MSEMREDRIAWVARVRQVISLDAQIVGLLAFLILLVLGFGLASPYFLST